MFMQEDKLAELAKKGLINVKFIFRQLSNKDSKNILPPVGIKLTGTLRLLRKAKNGKEIANVGIKDRRNAINKAVLGDNAEAFTLLLLFAVSTSDEDDDDIDGNDETEDDDDGTNKSLSSSEVVMALGFVRTVPPPELMESGLDCDC